MKYNVRTWNYDVYFHKMARLRQGEVETLKPGDELYYVNMEDEVNGVVYKVFIKEVHKYLVTMECYPVVDTIPKGTIFFNQISPHIESFSYVDACEDSNRILYKNLILSDRLTSRMYDEFLN